MPILGAGAQVGLGKESTYGTAVSTQTAIPLISTTMQRTLAMEDDPSLLVGAGGVVRRRSIVAKDVGGALEIALTYSGWGLLLEAATGGTVGTTGSGPYDHTFSCGSYGSLPSLTVRLKRGNTSYLAVADGVKVSRMSIALNSRAHARVAFDLIGQDIADDASGSPATATIPNLAPSGNAGQLSWNSASYSPVSTEIVLDNGLQRQNVVDETETQEPQPNAPRVVTVSAQLRLTAAELAALQSAYGSEAQSNLTITLTRASESLAVTVHNAQIITLGSPVSGHGPQVVTVTWAGTDDGTGSDGLTIVLTNANANYYE